MNTSTNQRIHYNGLTVFLHPDVYEPAEDTYLMIENISLDSKDRVLEVGTGSGLIALSCAQQGCNVTCTDLNPHAVRLTYKNYQYNKPHLKGSLAVIQGDLFQPIRPLHQFDAVLFNPPYLPTQPEEQIGGNGWFDRAVGGGPTGLDCTYCFLTQVKNYLKPTGKSYIIASSLSPLQLIEQWSKQQHLHLKKISLKHFDDETLYLYQLTPG